MIQHTWIVNFMHYACPLASTTTSLSIYINSKPNNFHIMFSKRLRVHLRGWGGSNPDAISSSQNLKKVSFRNTKLLQYLDIIGTHFKHGGNNYRSCIVAVSPQDREVRETDLSLSCSRLRTRTPRSTANQKYLCIHKNTPGRCGRLGNIHTTTLHKIIRYYCIPKCYRHLS